MMNQREVRQEQRIKRLEEAVFGTSEPESTGGPRTHAGTERRAPGLIDRMLGRRDGGKVDLNTADEEAIAKAVPGIGPKTAADLVAQRAGGFFTSFEDVAKRVGGVSLEQLRQVSDKITV